MPTATHLGEGDAQLRPVEQREVGEVPAVQGLHREHGVKHVLQHGLHAGADLLRYHDDDLPSRLHSFQGVRQRQSSHSITVVGGESHPSFHDGSLSPLTTI